MTARHPPCPKQVASGICKGLLRPFYPTRAISNRKAVTVIKG